MCIETIIRRKEYFWISVCLLSIFSHWSSPKEATRLARVLIQLKRGPWSPEQLGSLLLNLEWPAVQMCEIPHILQGPGLFTVSLDETAVLECCADFHCDIENKIFRETARPWLLGWPKQDTTSSFSCTVDAYVVLLQGKTLGDNRYLVFSHVPFCPSDQYLSTFVLLS